LGLRGNKELLVYRDLKGNKAVLGRVDIQDPQVLVDLGGKLESQGQLDKLDQLGNQVLLVAKERKA
jgi:hypothetical protein